MIESLEHIDHRLLLLINGFHSSLADTLMTAISGTIIWIPLYLLCASVLIKEEHSRVWVPLLFVVLLITLSDQISVHLFKDTVQRYRPCHNLELRDSLHLLEGACKGKYGFVSSHAANTFALATFLLLLFRKRWTILLLFWALLVSYSRVYLGVHYPSDVAVGALLGMLLAFIVFRFYRQSEDFFHIIQFKKNLKG
ncbi:MAG: phosphatase PAP2 family protein [Salinivirgaceae bacterium]|nr:phosphatase PAP2 family protein [Salinivirgaceae bacterium]